MVQTEHVSKSRKSAAEQESCSRRSPFLAVLGRALAADQPLYRLRNAQCRGRAKKFSWSGSLAELRNDRHRGGSETTPSCAITANGSLRPRGTAHTRLLPCGLRPKAVDIATSS